MYCQGCQTFASNGEPEAEIESNDDTTDAVAAVDITLRLPCGGCGGDFKEGTLSVEVDVAGQHDDEMCVVADGVGKELSWAEDEEKIIELRGQREFDIGTVEVAVSDDYRPKTVTLKKLGPDGKPIEKPAPRRSQRHYYDALVTLTATCNICEATFDVSGEDSISAGELEEVG